MFEKTVLSNGLRVVSSHLPHTRSVSLSLFVGAGSRYEDDSIAGVSHFVEHMLFKGTERRRTPREIAEAIEGVGGVMNAATDKELTVYWAKVPVDHFSTALDVLFDQLLYSRIDPVEVERERKVVIEELAMVEDSPGELAGLLFDSLMWPDQALGRDIAGSPSTVGGLTRSNLLDYHASQYVPENTVLAIAGNLSHERIVDEATERVADWKPAPYRSWEAARDGRTTPQVGLRSKRTEQAQLLLGYPAYSAFHPDRYALDILNTILGEGMSSRLFLEIRENRSLAYDVHSSAAHYLDTGVLVVGAAVDPSKTTECIKAVRGELDRLRYDLIPENELVKAKEYIKGRLLLRMEDSRAVSAWLGGQELLRGQIASVDEVVEAIDALTTDDLQRVAQDVIHDERAALAIVGPYRRAQRFERLLA
jgi:predicted Zn-dependent peptidase